MMREPIDDIELAAYIDGELDLSRRLAVEDHLSRHPALAARMMADLRNHSALKLLAKREPALSPPLADTVRRVRSGARPFWRRPTSGLAAVAAVAVLAVAVWDSAPAPPAYIDLALASHQSFKDRPVADRRLPADEQDLLRASQIVAPRLPDDWRVVDIEVIDKDKAPAMLIAVETSDGAALSILAIRQASSAPSNPDTVREGGRSVAYWRKGDFSYALTGEGDPQKIDATADALADSWKT